MMKWHFVIALLACLMGSVPAAGTVVAEGSADGTASADPFVMTVDTAKPYVQAQVLVTLRLERQIGDYPAVSFLVSAPPDLGQAETIVKPLEFRTSRKVLRRNGRRYLVTEWRYAVFPQTPGVIAIGPVTLNARAATADGYTRFEAFRTAPIRLHVRPVPAQFTGEAWLPAKSVHIYQGFNPDQSRLAVGSPISRRLAMTFGGAQNGELPAFNGSSASGFEIHPFRPRRSEQSTLTGLAATLEQQIILTPTRAGQLKIPSLAVPWWNTVTDQEEIARFPGYTLTVTPAPAGWGAGGVGSARAASSSIASLRAAVRSVPLPVWIAVVLAVVIGGAGLFGRAIIRLRGGASVGRSGFWTRLRLERRALGACAKDDAVKAAHAILCLARATDPAGEWRSLRQLAMAVPDPLQRELLALNAALFDAGRRPWRGDALRRALRPSMQLRANRSGGIAQCTLPRLHPLASRESAGGGWKS